MENNIITIIGGTGFLGRYVVRLLAKKGYILRVVSRHPSMASELKTAGQLGQVVLVAGNVNKPESLVPHIAGAFAVVNLTGILFERGRQRFVSVHTRAAEAIAKICKEQHVQRLVHVSALGVDKASGSAYARSKFAGEQAVQAAFSHATILRPSVVFGKEDGFFNMFGWVSMFSPVLPLIGGGKTKFQPVYVNDVAQAVVVAIENADTQGKVYELGGPEVKSFKEVLQYILRITARKAWLVPIPFWYAGFKAFFLKLMPGKPLLTPDQVRLLRYDNVVSAGAKTFADLGITPTPIDAVVPEYLARFKKPSAQHHASRTLKNA